VTSSEERFGEGFGAEGMWGLKELPNPDVIRYAPETWGWLVAGVLVVLLAFAFREWMQRRKRRNAYRQEGLARLEALESRHAIRELPRVLRRSALCAWPREEVASLRGEAWIAWLNRTAGRELFETSDADLIDRLAYLPETDESLSTASADRLLAAGRSWLRMHRAGV